MPLMGNRTGDLLSEQEAERIIGPENMQRLDCLGWGRGEVLRTVCRVANHGRVESDGIWKGEKVPGSWKTLRLRKKRCRAIRVDPWAMTRKQMAELKVPGEKYRKKPEDAESP